MPFKSEAQRGYLFAHHPKVAKEFASHMTHQEEEALPEHVKKMSKGGLACMHCGGAVEPDGYSSGGLVEDADEDEMGAEHMRPEEVSDITGRSVDVDEMRDFAKALKGRR
jgi:hypothetical protein